LKKTLPILLLLSISIFVTCKKTPTPAQVDENDEFYVSSFSGLALRNKPNLNSPKICLIEYHKKLKVIKYSTKSDTINNITAKWAFIEYEKYKGWGFAAYLKEELPFNKEQLLDFLANPFKNITLSPASNNSIKNSIIRQFGTPHSTRTENVKNIHYPSLIDKRYFLKYEGTSFTIYHVNEGDQQILESTVISANKESLKYGVKIGTPLPEIISIFGYPLEVKGNVYTYCPWDDNLSFVKFIIIGNKVKLIEVTSLAN
jgi:hypothetical protein